MRNRLFSAGRIVYIIYLVSAMLMMGITAMLDMLPGKYICVMAAFVAVFAVILAILLLVRRRNKGARITGIVIAALISILYITGGVYMQMTGNFVDRISDNGKDLIEYCVIAPVSEEKDDLNAVNGKDVHIMPDLDNEYIEAQGILEEKAKEEKISFGYEYTPDIDSMFTGLADGSIEGALLSRTAFDMYTAENVSAGEKVKIVFTVYVEKESSAAAKKVDVTEEPFNVYITGLDTTGTIDVQSLSDVNMIMTVNPVTKKILLTSIPRDYYVMLHDEQQMDKLTHTGSKGASATVATVEDLMECDINYYFKCNFSTVVSLIDAIGGITVESEYTFATHGRQNEGFYFTVGTNYLDGASALAFARERKSFGGGDRQRIKNQQLVLEATLNKVTQSRTLLTSYSQILSGLSDYLETSMSDSEMKALVKMQLDDMASWDIEKISLDGTGDSRPCYLAGGGYASVIIPDKASIDAARAEMAKVFSGKK
ncbi:MAG: LCP family protein [Firmicutes bacterium]|nr:LCP family protein [Bacillota bacterium]